MADGGYSSPWKKMGNNTNSTIASATSGGGDAGIGVLQDGLSNIRAGGTDNQVRHECTMWLWDDNRTYTKNMDWAVTGDFTIVLNASKNTLDQDPGAVEVVVQGSVDGDNFVDMQDTGDWAAGTSTVGALIYDFETYGRMPYMRLSLDAGTARSGNNDKPIKLCVFMHTT